MGRNRVISILEAQGRLPKPSSQVIHGDLIMEGAVAPELIEPKPKRKKAAAPELTLIKNDGLPTDPNPPAA